MYINEIFGEGLFEGKAYSRGSQSLAISSRVGIKYNVSFSIN